MPTDANHRQSPSRRGFRLVRRRGYTMIELVAAIAIMGAVLVTTLTLLRDGMELCRKADQADVMTLLATSRMEQELARAAADFVPLDQSGTFAAEGYSQMRWHAVHSDQSGSGGTPDRLMAVALTVWNDANGNSALDSTEAAVSFHSKIAKVASYQNELPGP